MTRKAALVLSLPLVLSACSAANGTTMDDLHLPGPTPEAVDRRTGAMVVDELLADGSYRQTVRRVTDSGLETLTVPLPSGTHLFEVRSFPEGVIAGDLENALYRYENGAWERVAIACGSEPVGLLVEARGMNDVWAVSNDEMANRATLCHFDGTTWTSEPLPFTAYALVELDTMFVTVDRRTQRVYTRPHSGGAWVDAMVAAEGESVVTLTPNGERAQVVLQTADAQTQTVLLDAHGAARLPVGVIAGVGDERWRVDSNVTSTEVCSLGIYGRSFCNQTPDHATHIVYRLDGGEREVGRVELERERASQWIETTVLGAGLVGVATSSGEMWVTREQTAPRGI